MTGDAVASGGRHVTGIGRRALRALGALGRVGAVVTGIAAARAHRRVVHRVGDEARRRVGVAVAALDAGHRDVRRRRQAQRRRAVVTARAIGVARSVNVFCARPTREARGRTGVAGDAVAPGGRHVTGVGCRALRTVRALSRIGPVVAGVAAAGTHRRMVHRVGDEARRGAGVAVAALNAGHRNVRRRGLAGRGCRRCDSSNNWCRRAREHTYRRPN